MAAPSNSKKPQKETLHLNKVVEVEKIRANRKFHITTVGFYLALCVLGYLSVVTIVIFVDYFVHAPNKPSPANLTAEALANYQTLAQISLQRITDLFDLMVAKTMIPVLTAILGYIFGVRESSKRATNSDDE